MRQRTVDDGFWRDPQLADLTQEDKATLLYLLTSPASNIVGAYRIVPRIAAAEMGWTGEQMTNVLRRLAGLDILRFDEPTSTIWIRIWWRHNRIALAMSPKLRDRALAEIAELPPAWRQDFADDMAQRGYPIDTLSIGLRYCTDTTRPNSNVNTISNVAAVPRARASERDAAAAPSTGVTAKKRNDRPSGIVVWEPTDSPEEAEAIERQYDQATISAAVDAVWKTRKHPVPGLVLAEIKRQALERTQATKEYEQRERDQAAIVAREQLRAEQDAEVAAYLQALDEDAHADLIAQFVEQLPEHNKPALKSYLQDGLKSKFVVGPFRQFVLARLHPDSHDHLQPTN